MPSVPPFLKRLAANSRVLVPWFIVAAVGTATSVGESNHARTTTNHHRQIRTLDRLVSQLKSGGEDAPSEEEIDSSLEFVGLRERQSDKNYEEMARGVEGSLAWEEQVSSRGIWDKLWNGKSAQDKRVRQSATGHLLCLTFASRRLC